MLEGVCSSALASYKGEDVTKVSSAVDSRKGSGKEVLLPPSVLYPRSRAVLIPQLERAYQVHRSLTVV